MNCVSRRILAVALIGCLVAGTFLSASGQQSGYEWSKSKKSTHKKILKDFQKELKARAKAGTFSSAQVSDWNALADTLGDVAVFPFLPIPVTYDTADAWGNPIKVSGVVILPLDVQQASNPRSLPILSFQHPTQVERQWSPSICLESLTLFKDPQFNVVLGMLFAACGYIVAIPDYPGMGSNTDVHPYCQNSLAYCVVDLVRKAGVMSKDKDVKAVLPITPWNGKVFMMGYSEGGYATMVAAKTMQLQAPGEFDVKAVACLDGPYSLSVTMRQLMLTADATYAAPYFLPYFVNAYDDVYYTKAPEGQKVDDLNYMNAIVNSIDGHPTYAQELREMLDGSKTGTQISNFMRLVPDYAGPRSVLQEGFQKKLADTSSDVVAKLAENNAYDNWTPTFPLVMFHHKYDDLVPYDNSLQAMRAFMAGGAEYVGLVPFSAHYFVNSGGSIHGAAAPTAYIMGFIWMNFLATQDDPTRASWPHAARSLGNQ